MYKYDKKRSENKSEFNLAAPNVAAMLIMAALFFVPGVWILFKSNIPDTVKLVYLLASFSSTMFFLYFAAPTKVRLNFVRRRFDISCGFGLLSSTQSGGFDGIECVYVRREGNHSYGPITYTLGIDFGDELKSAKSTAVISSSRNLVTVKETDRAGLSDYAEHLATKMNVPLKKIGW